LPSIGIEMEDYDEESGKAAKIEMENLVFIIESISRKEVSNYKISNIYFLYFELYYKIV
jgi:hypothetical protein